jgi:arginyl-tRNA--protein-N-Asp/Glu arginylyltransferase
MKKKTLQRFETSLILDHRSNKVQLNKQGSNKGELVFVTITDRLKRSMRSNTVAAHQRR